MSLLFCVIVKYGKFIIDIQTISCLLQHYFVGELKNRGMTRRNTKWINIQESIELKKKSSRYMSRIFYWINRIIDVKYNLMIGWIITNETKSNDVIQQFFFVLIEHIQLNSHNWICTWNDDESSTCHLSLYFTHY